MEISNFKYLHQNKRSETFLINLNNHEQQSSFSEATV